MPLGIHPRRLFFSVVGTSATKTGKRLEKWYGTDFIDKGTL
jgi:hypothetical protein